MGSETHLTQRYFDKEKTVKEYENRRTRHTKRKKQGEGLAGGNQQNNI
ncbi:MAG: hypothetical protein QXG69_07045 [Candidatus Caldarchaeum sp.]